MEVEELDQNNPVSLSVERTRGTFGRLTLHWAANGSLADVYPTSGVVRNPPPYCLWTNFWKQMLAPIGKSTIPTRRSCSFV